VFESVLFPYRHQRPDVTVRVLEAETDNAVDTVGMNSTFSLTIKTATETVRDLFFIAHDGICRRWRYHDIDCSGHFCYIRLNSEGKVENFFTGPDSHIEIEGQSLLTKEGRQ
jgi:hypothetical protein